MTLREFQRERIIARTAIRKATEVIQDALLKVTDDDLEYWLGAILEDMADHDATIEDIDNVGL